MLPGWYFRKDHTGDKKRCLLSYFEEKTGRIISQTGRKNVKVQAFWNRNEKAAAGE